MNDNTIVRREWGLPGTVGLDWHIRALVISFDVVRGSAKRLARALQVHRATVDLLRPRSKYTYRAIQSLVHVELKPWHFPKRKLQEVPSDMDETAHNIPVNVVCFCVKPTDINQPNTVPNQLGLRRGVP